MKVQSLTVVELLTRFADYNPRKISSAALGRLRRSLDDFGMVAPVVLNRRSAEKGWADSDEPVIVGGHQRVKAAELNGMDKMPVTWVDLDSGMEKALNIALNNPAMAGDWDVDRLKGILQELRDDSGLDATMTGFDTGQIDRIVGDMADSLDNEQEVGLDLEYRVIVQCKGEEHQVELLQRFEEEGLSCQALIS